MTPEFKQAVIDHCIRNFMKTNNPYQQAVSRIFEVREWFRAMVDEEKKAPIRPIDNRPDSEHTRDVKVTLDRLNGKAEE